jgi:hypothetical protein
MTPENQWKKTNYDSLADMQKIAASNLLLQELPSTPPIPRILAPEYALTP